MLVQNKGKYIRHAAGLMLIPGANQVESSDWKQFSSHPIMKKIIEKGEIVAHEESESVKDLSVNDAVELVKDTFDPALLESWREKEKRKGVLEAITSQMDEIKGLGDPEDK